MDGSIQWVAYLIVAVIVAIVGWFTFRRVPKDANRVASVSELAKAARARAPCSSARTGRCRG